jgi:hypothetical protein
MCLAEGGSGLITMCTGRNGAWAKLKALPWA